VKEDKQKQRKEFVIFTILLLGVLFLSVWSPTGNFVEFPKYWWDEAFSIEQARTLIELGRLDMTIAPNTPSAKAITFSSNGPPLSLPLAGIFSLFGIGIFQARVYMLFWIIATIIAIYIFLKKTFNTQSAIAGTLLVATFASFYANGRTATGDIPGLFFFITALYVFIHKRNYFWSGVLFALTAITKTSVFHMALPAAGIALLYTEGKNFFSPAFRFGLGALIIILAWFALLLPYPYSLSDITPLIEFYRNPTHKLSVLEQFTNNIPAILYSSTIIYFAAITIVILYALWKIKNELPSPQRITYLFFVFYAFLQTIVFLRSPGWLRYLIAFEVFALALLYPSLHAIAPFKKISSGMIGLLALFQLTHYLFYSDILPRADITPHVTAINQLLEENPGSAIGFVDNPMLAAFIPGSRKYQYIRVGGDTYIGIPFENFPFTSRPVFLEKPADGYEPIPLADESVIYRKN
jgi:hypothetical protein